MKKIIQYTNEELKKLQLNELELLIEFDRICKKNNIQYSLDGGTLLGAIRHKGFIPWDDDIDVMLLKEEYEKFLKACTKDLDSKRFFFQDYRTDKGYRWGYGKLRRLGTEYIKYGHENTHYKTGICIDIFCLENLPDNIIARKYYLIMMFCLRKILYSEIGRTNSSSFFLRLWYKFLYFIPKSTVFRIKDLLTYPYENSKTKNVINSMLPFPKPECKYGYPRELFNQFIEVKFEDFSFSVIYCYDKFLKMKYDNYMQIPPKEKQTGVMNATTLKLLDISIEDLKKYYWQGRISK